MKWLLLLLSLYVVGKVLFTGSLLWMIGVSHMPRRTSKWRPQRSTPVRRR